MRSIARPHLLALALVTALAGCSRDEPGAERTPITPAIEPRQHPHLTDNGEIVAAELNAAGAATSYEAHFTNGQLTRIDEKRARADDEAARGEYEFQGARLLRYTGAALAGDEAAALELDLQGRVVQARIGDRAARPEEISAIRARAQLLRSHALAQSAARAHTAREVIRDW